MDKNIEELEELLLDLECLDELNSYISRVNIFDVLRSTKSEIRHSNMLAWLFDVNGSHHLGKTFISKFIKTIISENREILQAREWAFIDFSSEMVFREWHKENDKENSLDILITFNDSRNEKKYLIAIENKIDSREHKNYSGEFQTERYRKLIETKFDGYEKMFIFLTPYNNEAEDPKWIQLTYRPIKDVLESIMREYTLDDVSKVLIDNYIQILRRDIMNDDLVKLCNDIYNKHPKAFDLIFENKKDEGAEAAEKVREALIQLNREEDEIVYDSDFDSGNTYIRFYTKKLDEIFGSTDDDNEVWKGDKRKNRRYFIEIHTYKIKENPENKLPIQIVITKKNFNDEMREKIISAIDPSKIDSKAAKTNQLARETLIDDITNYDVAEKSDIDSIKKKILDYVNKLESKLEKVK